MKKKSIKSNVDVDHMADDTLEDLGTEDREASSRRRSLRCRLLRRETMEPEAEVVGCPEIRTRLDEIRRRRAIASQSQLHDQDKATSGDDVEDSSQDD